LYFGSAAIFLLHAPSGKRASGRGASATDDLNPGEALRFRGVGGVLGQEKMS
jgi:hypothetical protein